MITSKILKKFHLELRTDRITALTDGIFAIAMTILVLNFDFHLPAGPEHITIKEKLRSQWPEFLHYVESFFILSNFWVKNHQQFHFIKKTDRVFLWVNIVGLMMICLIPYSTSVISDYGDSSVAALFFEINMLVVGAVYYYHWAYATSKNRLVDHDLSKDVIVFYKVGNLTIPILSAVAILISLWNPRLGTAVYLLVPFMPLIHTRRWSA